MTQDIEGGSQDSLSEQASQTDTREALKSIVADNQADQAPIPDSVITDKEMAVDVAYAGKPLRDVAAYHREVQNIAREQVQKVDASRADKSNVDFGSPDYHENRDMIDASIDDAKAQALAKLQVANERLVRDIGERAVSGRTISRLDNAVRDVRYQDANPDERYGDTQAGAEDAATEQAEHREKWAELIAKNPEAAGDWDVTKVISVERIAAEQETFRGREKYELNRITEMENDGKLSIGAIDAFAEVQVGSISDYPEERTPRQQEWVELSRSDSTTVGQLKDFVKRGYTDSIENRTKYIDFAQARLNAIRGTETEGPTEQVVA